MKWLLARWRGVAVRGAGRSSAFGELVDDRRAWLFATLPHEAAAYQYDVFTKRSQKRLARRLGFTVAEDYFSLAPLRVAIKFVARSRLDAFVIKANLSYGGKASRALTRTEGGYRDVRTLDIVTLARLEHDLGRELEELDRPDEWLVEELLRPFDPSCRYLSDYKFYVFGATTELIVCKRPVPGSYEQVSTTCTRDWELVDVGLESIDAAVAAAPLRGRELIAVAEEAASCLCYPFIRMDLYDTSRGVVVGELTPGPGRRHELDPEWDARFARRWHEAAANLRRDLRTGRIVPLREERSG